METRTKAVIWVLFWWPLIVMVEVVGWFGKYIVAQEILLLRDEKRTATTIASIEELVKDLDKTP